MRLAGINRAISVDDTFRVDLSSGSAPGAGTYTVDLALGDPVGGSAHTSGFTVKDTSTLLIDLTNGGSGYALGDNGVPGVNDWKDATVATVTLNRTSTVWTGATASKTFATTQANVNAVGSTLDCRIAHFRLTLQGAGAAYNPVRSFMLLGVGA